MKMKMINIFNFNLFKILRLKDKKICPTEYIGNRKRSQTEYSYKEMLQNDFSQKMENKRNKNSTLRLRGYSF
jgi:hypothetical protein